MAAFKPVVEPESPTAFLTAHPLTTISEQAMKTPLLFGHNHDDGAMKSARMESISRFFVVQLQRSRRMKSSFCNNFLIFSAILNIPGLFESFAQNVSFALPVIMEYAHLDQPVRDSITNKLVQFYFNNQIKREKMENLTNVIWEWFTFVFVFARFEFNSN